MTTETVAAPSKLPLWRTIGQAYAVWGGNLPDLVRVCWLWMLLMAPVYAYLAWWQAPRAMELMRAVRFGQPFVDPDPLLTMLTQIVGKLVGLPALASIAVAWHRLLLKDEHPGAGVYLRLDGIVAGYAVLAFFVGLLAGPDHHRHQRNRAERSGGGRPVSSRGGNDHRPFRRRAVVAGVAG
jgi:hypothetical protein